MRVILFNPVGVLHHLFSSKGTFGPILFTVAKHRSLSFTDKVFKHLRSYENYFI